MLVGLVVGTCAHSEHSRMTMRHSSKMEACIKRGPVTKWGPEMRTHSLILMVNRRQHCHTPGCAAREDRWYLGSRVDSLLPFYVHFYPN
ncbi:hypothetical protein SLA2020_388310 [Shorea laevis]